MSRTSTEPHRLGFADLHLGNVFSGLSHYIQQCDGMLVDTPKKIQICFYFFLFCIGKLGHGLVKSGLLWTHCPHAAYFMAGLHSGDSRHHLLTPSRTLCSQQRRSHFPQPPPPLAALAELQGTCSVSFLCPYIVPMSAWLVLVIDFPPSVLTHLHFLHARWKQLSAAVAAKVNKAINPPFTSQLASRFG